MPESQNTAMVQRYYHQQYSCAVQVTAKRRFSWWILFDFVSPHPPPWAWMNVENFPLINLLLAEKNMFITTRSDQYCGSMHYAAIVKMVKIEIRDSSQISTTGPIFLLSNYFRQKYLEIASCADSWKSLWSGSYACWGYLPKLVHWLYWPKPTINKFKLVLIYQSV